MGFKRATFAFSSFGASNAYLFDMSKVWVKGHDNHDSTMSSMKEGLVEVLEQTSCVMKKCFPDSTIEPMNFCDFVHKTIKCFGECSFNMKAGQKFSLDDFMCVDLTFLFGCDLRCDKLIGLFNEGIDKFGEEKRQDEEMKRHWDASGNGRGARGGDNSSNSGSCSAEGGGGGSSGGWKEGTMDRLRNEMMSAIWKSMVYLMSFTMH